MHELIRGLMRCRSVSVMTTSMGVMMMRVIRVGVRVMLVHERHSNVSLDAELYVVHIRDEAGNRTRMMKTKRRTHAM